MNLILFSVNEIEAELQTLKNSLINNNLLQSCTIRGVTDDWFQLDKAIGVEGLLFQIDLFLKIFLVDISDSAIKITQIDRINTWLTCHRAGCPAANGSNNVIPDPNGSLKFWVYLRRDASLDPPFTVQNALDADFKIHYEVEGPCA